MQTPKQREPYFANQEGKKFLKIIGIPIGLFFLLIAGCNSCAKFFNFRQNLDDDAGQNYSYQSYTSEPVVEEPKAPEEPPILITAVALNAAYQENEVAADQQFRGKKLIVEGRITRIAKNYANEPYITLESGQYFQDLHCPIPERIAATLRKGQTASLSCFSKGMVMNSVQLELRDSSGDSLLMQK